MGKNTATTRLRLGQRQFSQPKWTDMRGFEKIRRESEQVQLTKPGGTWASGFTPYKKEERSKSACL